MDYIYVFFAALIGCLILGGIYTYFDGGRVDCWPDQGIASVFISFHVKYGGRQTNIYTFEKNRDGKWKYMIDLSRLGTGIALFAVFLASALWFYYLCGDVPVLDQVITVLLLAVSGFILLIEDPIAAYFILMRHLKKNGYET